MAHTHRFSCTSGNPFVLAKLDGAEIALAQAMDIVSQSAFCSTGLPVVIWTPDRHFEDNDEILSEEQRIAPTLLQALCVVEACKHTSIFIIGVDARCLREKYLPQQFQTTITAIQQMDIAGKKLVLVADHGTDPAPLFENCRFGSGRLISEERKAGSGTTEHNLDRLLETIMQTPPGADDDPWPLDDDPEWVDAIDALTRQETEIVYKAISDAEGNKNISHPLARLRKAQQTVRNQFVSRGCAFEILVACALARTNSVMLGPPGTAKSLMVRSFAQTLGVRLKDVPISRENEEVRRIKQGKQGGESRRRYFEYLLTRYTTPEELFGGTDIDALVTRGVHCRRTIGMLPRAGVAFLDEVFKANSAILNTLLSIINEGIFYNMGQPFKVNVAFVVGASNETPDEEELGALFDRFPVRIPCYPVPETEMGNVIEKSNEFEAAKSFRESARKFTRVACLNDLRLLSKIVQGAAYGSGETAFEPNNQEFKNDFMRLCLAVRRDYGVSDRTPMQMLRLCRALALLEGADSLEPKHLRVWGYVAPKLAQFEDLQRAVRVAIQERDPSAAKLFDEV